MLPVKYRLGGRKQIAKLARFGKRFTASHFSLRVLAVDESICRFAVVVAKQKGLTAAARNRLKRRLRETVRQAAPDMRPGIHVLVKTSGSAETLRNVSGADIKKELHLLFHKASIL